MEFLRAFELTRNPAVLFNISATHELTGHYVEALDAMLDYERLAPRETVAQRRDEINAALARLRGRVGTVVIRFEAAGLDVRVDNLQRAASEARTGLRLPAGRHRISLSAPHYTPRDIEAAELHLLAERLTRDSRVLGVGIYDQEGRWLGGSRVASVAHDALHDTVVSVLRPRGPCARRRRCSRPRWAPCA